VPLFRDRNQNASAAHFVIGQRLIKSISKLAIRNSQSGSKRSATTATWLEAQHDDSNLNHPIQTANLIASDFRHDMCRCGDEFD
jgi:hypothetical protein